MFFPTLFGNLSLLHCSSRAHAKLNGNISKREDMFRWVLCKYALTISLLFFSVSQLHHGILFFYQEYLCIGARHISIANPVNENLGCFTEAKVQTSINSVCYNEWVLKSKLSGKKQQEKITQFQVLLPATYL